MIYAIGIGLNGASGLTNPARQLVLDATLLVGSDRHLSYFRDYQGERLVLKDFKRAIDQIQQRSTGDRIAILVSGDPLFFGFGRLLLAEFPAEQIEFHPHLSSVQLAFNRIKIPWQDARLISAHGRSLDELIRALQQGVDKIAVLTDFQNTPTAIARLLESLDLPSRYDLWVCENLEGAEERVERYDPEALAASESATFAPLNVAILVRRTESASLDLATLPKIGLSDRSFLSFDDRPGLMTKREVRLLVLGELALQSGQTIWDIGAGTGSVSIEIARLCPDARIFALETTAMGVSLIERNARRFQVENITICHRKAPEGLESLPAPDRVFIGGSGGNLPEILEVCGDRLSHNGKIVLALATLEHLQICLNWVQTRGWKSQLLQVQLSRSVAVSSLTRFAPLNPVTIVGASRESRSRA
ncbi:MAG: precorrin-6y C5,15-methyltransferase (decarboxylating) subunit CbiE [Cyanobacteriota bacterium]|nr:precorrin-6y C5,15-methyltransferase (decarboxylating) subunit CbiE [Cyanobacteriota bacterium]